MVLFPPTHARQASAQASQPFCSNDADGEPSTHSPEAHETPLLELPRASSIPPPSWSTNLWQARLASLKYAPLVTETTIAPVTNWTLSAQSTLGVNAIHAVDDNPVARHGFTGSALSKQGLLPRKREHDVARDFDVTPTGNVLAGVESSLFLDLTSDAPEDSPVPPKRTLERDDCEALFHHGCVSVMSILENEPLRDSAGAVSVPKTPSAGQSPLCVTLKASNAVRNPQNLAYAHHLSHMNLRCAEDGRLDVAPRDVMVGNDAAFGDGRHGELHGEIGALDAAMPRPENQTSEVMAEAASELDSGASCVADTLHSNSSQCVR